MVSPKYDNKNRYAVFHLGTGKVMKRASTREEARNYRKTLKGLLRENSRIYDFEARGIVH